MQHGNILYLINADEAMIASVEVIVTANSTEYKLYDSLFYIETSNIVEAEDIVAALKNLDVVFLFYYNNLSNGSKVWGNTGNTDLATIRKIML
jgi:hypothetical protein